MAKRFSAPEYEEKAKEIVSGGYGYYDREKKEAFYVPKHRSAPAPAPDQIRRFYNLLRVKKMAKSINTVCNVSVKDAKEFREKFNLRRRSWFRRLLFRLLRMARG